MFFGRGRGRGGRATAKPTDSRRSSADGFAVKMKQTKAGGRIVKSCSPFSAAKWQRQKSRQSRGKSADFLRSKKYYSALDGLDSRNGHRTGIVFGGEICYNLIKVYSFYTLKRGADCMQYWKAHYRDALHDTAVEIINTEEDYNTEPLSFTLDNITFCGTSLNDFHLKDEVQYGEASKKFSLLKWGGHDSKFTSPYLYDLQRYELEVEIPINVFRKRDGCIIAGVLFLSFKYIEPDMSKLHSSRWCDGIRVYCDDVIVQEFSLSVDGMSYKSSEKTLWFEAALKDICKQIKDGYYIKCCFTCQYSDYSPYGSDDYGLMLCFCRHKSDCLKVNSKDDFFTFLEGKDYDGRQETYLCEHYCLRNKASGYRGFVDGIN